MKPVFSLCIYLLLCNSLLAQKVQIYEQKGDSALAMRNYTLAISSYQNALNSNPNNPDIKAKQGLAYLESGEWDKGNALFEEAIKLNPNKLDYLVYRLDVLVRKRNLGQAREVFVELQRRGWSALNSDATMCATVGNFYMLEGKAKEAQPLFQKAIEKAPQEPLFYAYLADNQKTLAQFKDAYFSAQRALELGYSSALEILLELYPNLPVGITAETPDNAPKAYYIHDLAFVLNGGDLAELNQKLTAFHQTTGTQLGIITLPTLAGKVDVELAEQLCKVWNLNYQTKKAILVLVAIQDKKMRLHTLAETKQVISDTEATSLLNTYLRPAFRKQAYSAGLLELTNALQAKVKGDVLPQPSFVEQVETKRWEYQLVFGVFILTLLISAIVSAMHWVVIWLVGSILVHFFVVPIPMFGIGVSGGLVLITLMVFIFTKSDNDKELNRKKQEIHRKIHALSSYENAYKADSINEVKQELKAKIKDTKNAKNPHTHLSGIADNIKQIQNNPAKYFTKLLKTDLILLEKRWEEVKNNFLTAHQDWVQGKIQILRNTLKTEPQTFQKTSKHLQYVLNEKYAMYCELIKIVQDEKPQGFWAILEKYCLPNEAVQQFKQKITFETQNALLLEQKLIESYYKELKATKIKPALKFSLTFDGQILVLLESDLAQKALQYEDYSPEAQERVGEELKKEATYFATKNGQKLPTQDEARLQKAIENAQRLCESPQELLGWNKARLAEKCSIIMQDSFWEKFAQVFTPESLEQTKKSFRKHFESVKDKPEDLGVFYEQRFEGISTNPQAFLTLKPAPKSQKNPNPEQDENPTAIHLSSQSYFDTAMSYDDYADYADYSDYSDTASSSSSSSYSDSSSSYSDSSSSYSDSSSSYSDSSGGGSSDW